MSHRLDPLLQPRSIALVGATTRENAPGRDMLLTLKRGGFAGQAWAINPKYPEVEGFPCLPSIAAIGQPVDLAILSVANAGLERALTDAAKAGTRAAVIFASATVPEDPKLGERLAAIAREAAMPLCGVNCMGFYNDEAGVWACGFPSKRQRDPGHIAFIAQSGSVFGCIAHNDPRYRLNLAVSPGSETVTTAADYIDYALSRPSTRVIGLFLESVRDPENFVAALVRAERQRIPIVVLKVGRSEVSRRLALSHTGALTGDDAAFDALCRRHGVLRVRSIDELAATLLLLSADRRLGPGGLATMHDSGGERELLADLAIDQGVPFAQINDATTRRLGQLLEPGLEPANPLDAWGTGVNFVENFTELLTTLAEDPDTAIAALVTDARDHSYVHDGFVESALRTARRTDKPVAIVVNFSGVKHDGQVLRAKEAGVPLLDGTVPALQAMRHALDFRDHRPAPPAPALPPLSSAWRARLGEPSVLSEAESLALLADFGLPVARSLPGAGRRRGDEGRGRGPVAQVRRRWRAPQPARRDGGDGGLARPRWPPRTPRNPAGHGAGRGGVHPGQPLRPAVRPAGGAGRRRHPGRAAGRQRRGAGPAGSGRGRAHDRLPQGGEAAGRTARQAGAGPRRAGGDAGALLRTGGRAGAAGRRDRRQPADRAPGRRDGGGCPGGAGGRARMMPWT